MTITKIHCHSQADKSTLGFVKFMWETMVNLANHPEALHITVHCMGPAATERLSNLLKNGQTRLVPGNGKEGMNGSYGHGACIMDALAMTGDDEIHIIADSDTVMIAKGWDDYVRKRLLDDNIGIMGTTYEDLGGFSSGKGTTQTYKRVPTVTWCALNPRHDWRDLDVLPNKGHIITINTDEQVATYNLPIGYSIFGEVAYQIPQYVRDKNLTYDGWRQLKPTKDAIVLRGLSDYHEEYHTTDGRVPFLAHHRGSMKHAYRGDKISTAFYGAIDRHLISEINAGSKWSHSGCTCSSEPIVKVEVDDIVPSPNNVPIKDEWLKVSLNGQPIRRRDRINRYAESPNLAYSLPPNGGVHHIRIEGNLAGPFSINVQNTVEVPYMITCRNVSGASMIIATEGGHERVAVPNSKTMLLLVDVDGVCHAE